MLDGRAEARVARVVRIEPNGETVDVDAHDSHGGDPCPTPPVDLSPQHGVEELVGLSGPDHVGHGDPRSLDCPVIGQVEDFWKLRALILDCSVDLSVFLQASYPSGYLQKNR